MSACRLCDRGFPLVGGDHVGTHALGMIPTAACTGPAGVASAIEELRETAEAIVKGVGDTWHPRQAHGVGGWGDWHVFEDDAPIATVDPTGCMGAGTAAERIARFMAAAHPRRVLAVLDRLRALEEFAAEVKATLPTSKACTCLRAKRTGDDRPGPSDGVTIYADPACPKCGGTGSV